MLKLTPGSLSELETQIIISKRLKFSSAEGLNIKVETIRKKLINLIKYHKSKGKGK
mgnify:CR=1 FL=1